MIYIFGGAFDPPHVGHTAIVKSILAKKHPEKIIIIPSSKRDDKEYHVSDEHRLAMLEIFVSEIGDNRIIIDDYFIHHWSGYVITRDIDLYARKKYGENSTHIFGSDTIDTMPHWDNQRYALHKVRKLFIPRLGSSPEDEYISLDESLSRNDVRNFEVFTDCHIPQISSTQIRERIPSYSTLKAYFEEDPKFIIPGLSKHISQYILRERIYLPKNYEKPKVLVHVCCGPDATMPILALKHEYDILCFWYDPNIQPKSEYDKRYEAFVKVCEIENIPFIKGAYDVKNFFRRIRGFEFTPEKGEKCTHCYDMRMYVSAKLSARLGIPYYTSSLNTSPKKDLEKLFRIGHKYAKKYGITFLDIPFRKKGGFEKSVYYTRQYDIFRQNYCGCIYSIREGGESEMKRRMVG